MTERQQLINRYVNSIKPSIATKYYLHLLRNEKDSASISMLQNQLEQIATQTGCQEIIMVANSATYPNASIIIGGQFVKPIQNKEEISSSEHTVAEQKEKYSSRANSCLTSFQFKNALVYYEKALRESRKDKFYLQRIEANYMLDNYNVAYALACKTGSFTLKFLMAVTSGHFQEANEIIPSLDLDENPRSLDSKTFVNKFCLIQLIMYVKLATSPSTDVIEMFEKLSTTFIIKLTHISNIVDAFKSHEYGKAMQYINSLEPYLYDSLYAAPVSKEIINEMVKRNIINFILPCNRISLLTIAEQSSTDISTVRAHVVSAIRDGDLTGKIDPETDEYIHFDSRYSEVVKLYNDLSVIGDKVDRALFMFTAKNFVTEP